MNNDIILYDRSGRNVDNNEGPGDFVFVTYSWNRNTDPEAFIHDVVLLCQRLRRAGIKVKIDMDEGSFASLGLNRFDWVDRNVREARYVIACITPTYADSVRASPQNEPQNTRCIYEKLKEEFYRNHSQNLRTIPLMFPLYGTVADHIPPRMRSTLTYMYPDHVGQIIQTVI